MLARLSRAPSAAATRFGTRGLTSILAAGRGPLFSGLDQSVPGVSLHHAQTNVAGQDSQRPYSCAFPARALTFSDRLQRPLYALHIQTSRKATVPVDPEKPKRPISAYFRFAAEHREKQGVKDMKKIGAAWKQLTPSEKEPFDQAYKADQAVYQEKVESYKASGKKDAWDRDPAKPKRPLTPFFEWKQQKMQERNIAELPVTEASKVLGAAWAEVSADKKAPLQAKFKAEMEKYKAALKSYKESGAETAWKKRTGRLELEQKAEAKKQAQKDKIKEEKAKKLAKDAQVKQRAKDKAAKAKAAKAKAKAAKAKAVKAKAAAKAKAAKLKAAKAKAAKAKLAKAKAEKAKAAKAAKAKAAKEKALKAKAAKAAKAKAAREKALKAKEAKAAKAKERKAKAARV